jgi:hypothetical protein
MKLAAAHVRDGLGPFFLELQTYRFRAHSMFDPELYRDKAEVEAMEDARPAAHLLGATEGGKQADGRGIPRPRCEGERRGAGLGRLRRGGAVGTGRGFIEGRAHAMKMTYREAIRQAMHEALAADPRVFLMGEDVGKYGGTYACSKGFLEEFGPERIRDTPLSELGFVGAGIGAALGGLRPIVEVMTVNFSLLALDQIVNTAAALRHMSGGQFSVPLVLRMATGAGRQLAAQHSHSLENWYAHIPGIKVLAPATIADARGMLGPALADPDPVVIFEHAQLYNLEGELPETTGAATSPRRRCAAKARTSA